MSNFSANRFALLDTSDEESSAPAALAPAPAPVPVKKTVPGQQAAPKQQRGDYPARGGARKVFKETESPVDSGAETREERGERRGRGGPRGGRGAPRGRGRGAKFDRPDRHSQTGITDTDKKVASGWGADEGKKELKAETDGWGDAKADASAPDTPVNGSAPAEDSWAATPAGDSAPPAEPEQPVEEEDKTKTLDEYLAERAAGVHFGPALTARKANEGVDDSQWKDGVELVRGAQDNEEWFIGNKTEKPVSAKARKEKTFIEIEPIAYRSPRSDRGGDRGRGRGRGRGEGRGRGRALAGGFRGAPRGGRGGLNRDLDPEDANAFPSLS